jgi:nucleoside-diphosphate-sugar epimerase
MSGENKPIKRILLLRATGRTGKHILEYALSQGYEVAALVRSLEKISLTSKRLKVVKGTPENQDDVTWAIEGCDAVVSALGVRRSSEAPWAKSLSSPMFLTNSIGNCLEAMKIKGMRHIIVLTGIGTGDSFSYAPAFMRFLIRATRLGGLKKDFDGEEALFQEHIRNNILPFSLKISADM